MAKSKNNVITHGLSGKIADLLIFSQRNGKTIVSKVTEHKQVQTAKQKAHIEKFQEAVIYAKGAMKDPAAKAAYAAQAEDGLTPYNVAVADMLNAPDIDEVDLDGYTGRPGDTITIKATDDFKVIEVTVTITNADGSLVEEGGAVMEPTHGRWVYTATATNADLHGDKISIKATDIPGNLTKMQQEIA